VRTGSAERAEAVSGALWTYDPASFLPHGTARDGSPEERPIWITPDDENPNGATILILTDGMEASGFDGFDRCLEMFDGRDDEAVAAARARWSGYKSAGHSLTYWQQTEAGGWEKRG